VVDDNIDFGEFLSLLLAHQGYVVRTATSGQQCLDEVRQQRPDLIVLDVMMPQMDGIEVCRRLKQDEVSTPVFLLTAKDDLATRTKAIELAVSEFLAKPVNIEDFLTRVGAQCKVRQWDQELDAALPVNAQDGSQFRQ